MYIPSSSSKSSVTSRSIMLKKTVNSVGAKAQPCLKPSAIGKGCDRSLLQSFYGSHGLLVLHQVQVSLAVVRYENCIVTNSAVGAEEGAEVLRPAVQDRFLNSEELCLVRGPVNSFQGFIEPTVVAQVCI